MTDPLDPTMATGAEPTPSAVPADSTDSSATSSDPADAALFAVIDRLSTILDHSDLVELEVQVGTTGLTLRKPAALPQPVGPGPADARVGSPTANGAASGAPAPAAPGAAAAADEPTAPPSVKAPLTGIWYGSPAPGSAPYVQVGGEVAVGQVIGLIEAMKLFNEIKSDLAGRVVKVHAENGKLIKAKQPLIEVTPL
jgi:acetyl-CoA carboxylase biotin carboxyl carrier protein